MNQKKYRCSECRHYWPTRTCHVCGNESHTTKATIRQKLKDKGERERKATIRQKLKDKGERERKLRPKKKQSEGWFGWWPDDFRWGRAAFYTLLVMGFILLFTIQKMSGRSSPEHPLLLLIGLVGGAGALFWFFGTHEF